MNKIIYALGAQSWHGYEAVLVQHLRINILHLNYFFLSSLHLLGKHIATSLRESLLLCSKSSRFEFSRCIIFIIYLYILSLSHNIATFRSFHFIPFKVRPWIVKNYKDWQHKNDISLFIIKPTIIWCNYSINNNFWDSIGKRHVA